MPKYIATHTLPKGITPEQVRGIQEASQQGPECVGERSFINLTQGKGACVWTAPSRSTLERWFADHEVPFDDIYEIEMESEHAHAVTA